jgi:membrane protein implicated in regulation of membrane protease activity
MSAIALFYDTHPFWSWMGVAALLLAVEVATGSGYLLWPAAAAGAAGFAAMLAPQTGAPGQIAIFAVLTIVSTLLARRYLPRRVVQPGPDVNDRAGRLVGRLGESVGDFEGGCGRVFVDGAEWIAELDADAPAPAPGGRVEVIDVLGGGRLRVRGA